MFINSIKSEWVKAKSIKSTWILTLLSLLFPLCIVTLICNGTDTSSDIIDSANSSLEYISYTIWQAELIAFTFSSICLIIFAVLTITSEYNFSTINTSLLATPKRGVFFFAKITFITIFVSLVCIIGTILSFLLGVLVMSTKISALDIFMNGAQNGFLFNTLGILALVLLSTFLGFVIRNSAASISISIVTVTGFASSIFMMINHFLKQDFIIYIANCLPDRLYSVLVNPPAHDSTVSNGATQGSGVEPFSQLVCGVGLVNWVVILGIIAFILFKKRDA